MREAFFYLWSFCFFVIKNNTLHFLQQIKILFMFIRIFLIYLSLLFNFCGPKLSNDLSILSITADTRLNGSLTPWDFEPLHLLDDNPKSVWCADSDTGTITLILKEPIEMDVISFLNGNASNPKMGGYYGQVTKLQVTAFLENKINDSSLVLETKKVSFETDGKARKDHIHLEKSLKGDKFEFKILESEKGKSSSNVCITEIKPGKIKKEKDEFYPLRDKTILTEKSNEYEKAKKHYFGYVNFTKYAYGGIIIPFCDLQNCMSISLNSDGTFTFGDYSPINPDPDVAIETLPNFKKSVTGSFKQESITLESGVEVSFKFFDTSGIELTELMYFKVCKKGDKEYDTFKTMMGEKFRLYEDKTYFLINLESRADNSYHKEMKLYTTEIPLKLEINAPPSK